MALVEIKSNETFSYYPGSLKDIDQNRALVSYEDNWKADEWVPLENVRAAATKFDPTTFQPLPGHTVEAMAKSSENEPYSWWQAVVKNVRGEFYFISYSAFDDTFNEILEKDMLRPFNTNPSLKFSDFSKQEIPLPRELWDSVSSSQFTQLRETTGCLSLHVDNTKHALIVLGQPANVKRAKLLATMTMKHLVELQRLQAKTLTKRSEIDQLMQRQKEGVTEEFKCDPAIMGLVIGKKGKNIKMVEALDGIMKVRVDSVKGVVNILAKDAESARRARALLEFVDQRYPIEAASVGRIVGKNFQNIRDIEQNSGVVRIKVGDDDQGGRSQKNPKPDEMIDLVIVGTREAVADAVILLDQHINFLKTYSQLSEEDRTLSDKINQLALDVGPVGEHRPARGRGGYNTGYVRERRAPDGEDEADYDRSDRRGGGARRGGVAISEAGAGRGRGGRGGSSRGRGRGIPRDSEELEEEKVASAPAPVVEEVGRGRGRGRGGAGRGRGRGGQYQGERVERGQVPREKEESADPVSDRPPRDSRARRTDEDKDVNEVGTEAKPKRQQQQQPRQPKKQPEYKPVDKKEKESSSSSGDAADKGDSADKKESSGDDKDKKPRNNSRGAGNRRPRQEASDPKEPATVADVKSASPPPTTTSPAPVAAQPEKASA